MATRKLLLAALAGLVTSAIAPVAAASGKACELELFAFRGSAPRPQEVDVPLDARVLVAYESCGSGSRGTITLWQRGVAIPLEGETQYGWSADARWATLKPAHLLEPDTTYVVSLETDRGSSVTSFTTGHALSTQDAASRPSLRVLSAAFAGPQSGSDGRAPAAFTLELIHPNVGRLGAFYLGGPTRVENTSDLVTERLALADGRPTVPVLQTLEARPGEPTCFSVLYEDAAGRLSSASEPACAVVSGAPPPAEGGASDAGGCSTGGASRGGPALPVGSAVAALAVVAMLRRVRGSRSVA